MRKLILISIILSFYSSNIYAQCDSLICNMRLSPKVTNYDPIRPFEYNQVNCWFDVTLSPQLNPVYLSSSSPTSAHIWSLISGMGITYRESFAQNFNALSQSEKYAFSMMVRRDNPVHNQTNGNGTISATLTYSTYYSAASWAGFSYVLNQSHQIIASTTPSTNYYTQYQSCIDANAPWNSLAIYSTPNSGPPFWGRIDDIELYRVYAFAGNDTVTCDTPLTITLGSICNLTTVNVQDSFKWFVSGISTAFATTDTVTVTVSSTTTYILKHYVGSCVNTDSVVITIIPPPNIDLGPDTTICGNGCITLDAGYDSLYDSLITYLWNTTDTTQTILVCNSGTYWVISTAPGGCSDTDTVIVTFHPDITLNPDDTIICNYGFPLTLSVTSGYQSYRWYTSTDTTTLGTNDTLIINLGGTYIVTVNDSVCTRSDSIEVEVLPTPIVDLGQDTLYCGDTCVTLDAGYDPQYDSLNSYLWNTGDTTQTIVICWSDTIWAIATTPDGCSDTDTIILNFWPDIEINPRDTSVCINYLPITLEVDGGYDTYSWSTGSSTNTTVFDTNSSGVYTISVTVTDSVCTKTDSVTIFVLEPPFVELGPDTVFWCNPDTLIELGTDTLNMQFSYTWNTGDTTSYIYVDTTGTYWVQVTTEDSCFDSDTIYIIIDSLEAIINSIGPFCYPDDSCYRLKASPAGGTFYGKGVNSTNGCFTPSVAGIGNHSINYLFTDSNNCTFLDTIIVIVRAQPLVGIIPAGPVCVNDSSFYFSSVNDSTYTLTSSQWSGAVDSNGLFDPSSRGVGTDTIVFSIIDTFGCSNSDTFIITVLDTFNVSITYDTSGTNCEFMALELTAEHSMSGDIQYLWSTGERTQSITISRSGTYNVIVIANTDSFCNAIDTILIELANCCEETPDISVNDTIRLGTLIEWTDTILYISADIVIQDSATLEIENSTIVMMNCSKIIVQRGGYLKIINSSIGGCDWKGIDVWGHIDGCGDEYPNNVSQPVHGRVYANGAYISNADIGIFAGKRGRRSHDRLYGGGVVNALNSHFKYNYVDIMFSEFSFAGICSCADSGATWHSDIQNNLFDSLSNTFYCDPFVDSVLSKYNWYYTKYDTGTHCDTWNGPSDPNPLDMLPTGNCHIIDLSPFTDIWVYLRGISCFNACKRSAWLSGETHVGDGRGNIMNNNTYVGGCKGNIDSEFK